MKSDIFFFNDGFFTCKIGVSQDKVGPVAVHQLAHDTFYSPKKERNGRCRFANTDLTDLFENMSPIRCMLFVFSYLKLCFMRFQVTGWKCSFITHVIKPVSCQIQLSGTFLKKKLSFIFMDNKIQSIAERNTLINI